jgi:hypothetical protein
MKSYGRKRQHHHGYENPKLQKGEVCWWEVEFWDVKSKKTERQKLKRDMGL